MTPGAKEPKNQFEMCFYGCFISLIFKQPVAEGSVTDENNAPLAIGSVRGYLLDMDDEYMYLGNSTYEIDYAIARDTIAMVSFVDIKTPEELILDAAETPDDETGYN